MSNSQITDPAYFIKGILSSDISILSRAITLVESTKEEHQQIAERIIDGVIEKTGRSFRLGITGCLLYTSPSPRDRG